MQVETVAAPAAAPPAVVANPEPAKIETPAAETKPIEQPKLDTPEARDNALIDELSAVWDKQFTNGVEKDEKGRFVSSKPKDEAPQTNSADQPQAAQPEPAKPVHEAPLSWSAEAKAHWAKLPPEAQTYIAQRESEAHKAITTQGERLKSFEPLDEVLSHYKGDFARRGVQPAQALATLFEAQRKLDTNPLDGLVSIGLSYGIDLRPLLNGQPAQVVQQNPDVASIRNEIAEVKQQISARQQQEFAQRATRLETQVLEFSKDKPYFKDVENDVLDLIPVYQRRHPDASEIDVLSKAYDAAIYANSTVRERILTDQRKADEKKRQEEATARAEEARKSGKVNVRSGTAQPTPKSMDDTIEEIARRAYG